MYRNNCKIIHVFLFDNATVHFQYQQTNKKRINILNTTEKPCEALQNNPNSAPAPVMPDKSYVRLELVVDIRRSIPWEYAKAARLCTVLDDDDRIDAKPTCFFCLVVWLGPGFHIFIFIFKETQEGPNRSEEQLFLLT